MPNPNPLHITRANVAVQSNVGPQRIYLTSYTCIYTTQQSVIQLALYDKQKAWYRSYKYENKVNVYCLMVYALYTAYRALYTVQYTVYSIRYTIYSIRYTIYSIRYTIYSIRYTIYSIHYTIYSIRYTVYSIRYTIYSIRYTIYSIRYTIYSIRYTIHNMRNTLLHRQVHRSRDFLPPDFLPPRFPVQNRGAKIRYLISNYDFLPSDFIPNPPNSKLYRNNFRE